MRFVIYGAGAVGGVVGARLHQSGHDVTLIARGAHLEVMRRDGLTLLTPEERAVVRPALAGGPAEVAWHGDEVVLLATKSQDTAGALAALRDTPGGAAPVVCLQNGVENERVARRLVDDVYGGVVMAPTAHLEPGVVEAYGATLSGMIDIGRYPRGPSPLGPSITAALAEARFEARAVPDVMRHKHAKLVLNLSNAVDALCAPGPGTEELSERARSEGRAVLDAAGIDHRAGDVSDLAGRWQRIGVGDIDGRPRAGSSTWQSLRRGTPVETDYLNGEIVLQGALHGVPTPVNRALCRRMAAVVSAGGPPGSVAADELLAVAA